MTSPSLESARRSLAVYGNIIGEVLSDSQVVTYPPELNDESDDAAERIRETTRKGCSGSRSS